MVPDEEGECPMRETIPESYRWVCDLCGWAVPYDKGGLPQGWGKVSVQQDALDYQGHPVADGSIYRHVCHACKKLVLDYLELVQKEHLNADQPPSDTEDDLP